MPKYIIKIHDEKFNKDYYMEWSTIVDAPLTYGLSLENFKQYYSGGDLEERLERVEKNGTSAKDGESVDDMISCNRAGKDETTLSKEQILEDYCRNPIV